MKRPIILGWLAMLLCLGLTVAAQAQSSSIRRVVIEAIDNVPIDEEYIRAHLEVTAGAPLDRVALNRDVKNLVDTGRFSDVQVVVKSDADGVTLVYRVAQRWRLSEAVAVRGNDHFRAGKIRRLLDLSVDEYIDDAVVGTAVQLVLAEYRKDFMPDVKITWTILPEPQYKRDAKVELVVDEGKRAKVSRLNFVGNQAIPSRELRDVLRRFAWYNPISWFRRLRYDPEILEDARQRMRTMYLEKGYRNVEINTAELERDDEGQVIVTYTIREDVPYRIGKVQIDGSGTQVFPVVELDRQMQAPAGAVAAQSLIDNNRQTLRDYFGSRGYIDTQVALREMPDPKTGLVDLHFTVREGAQASIRNIDIRGNSRTRDKVIRRELLVYPGEIYDEVKVRRSERIASNLGFFSRVQAVPMDTAVEGEKDLLITVEEQRTGQFMIGAGFSSIDKAIGFLEISQGNFDIAGWPYFTGAGQKLRFRAQVGSERSDYELSFVEPWFLDRKLALGVDLFRRESRFSEYDMRRTGGAVSLGRALPGPNRISVQYQLESVEILDISDTNLFQYAEDPRDDFLFTDEEDNLISTVRLTFKHDTRDQDFIPTRGNQVIAFGETAGGVLGFDVDLYRLGMSTTTYIPLFWGHVLNIRSRAEVVEVYGDTDDVPITERLFIGGGRTLRGFDYREVGPKVVREDGAGRIRANPVGGQTLGMASAEYLIPLISKLRFATFYDIGNVWRGAYDYDENNYAAGAGVGLRLDFPGFPIRIDRAWAVRKDSDLTGEDVWVFWIGY